MPDKRSPAEPIRRPALLSSLPPIVQSPLTFVYDLLFTHRYTLIFGALFVLLESVLLGLIVRYVRFTEIDFETYLQQADLYANHGVRDYREIKGDSGPCVYPAGHLYVYAWLLRILRSYEEANTSAGALGNAGKWFAQAGFESKAAAEGGRRVVQYIFAGFYLVTFALVMDIYRMAAGTFTHSPRAKRNVLRAPSQALPPILHIVTFLMSKRLHSIFVLRLFNDPIAMMLFYLATWLLCKRAVASACIVYSLALSIKMNLLLFIPAWATVIFRIFGFKALVPASLIPLTQAILSYPFTKDHARSYLSQAFDFSRAFLYKWTVNWRFLSEDVFLSSYIARVLLLTHASVLLAFITYRWTELGRKGLWRWLKEDAGGVQSSGRGGPTPRFIAATLFTSNLIGITFSRSLHYQFFSWYAHQIPFLIWCADLPLVIKLFIPLAISYGWETFPSTTSSSLLLFLAHLTLLWGLWKSDENDALADGVRALVALQREEASFEQDDQLEVIGKRRSEANGMSDSMAKEDTVVKGLRSRAAKSTGADVR